MKKQSLKPKVLILGGEGYLGSKLIPKIFKNFEITSCDTCFFGKKNNTPVLKNRYQDLKKKDLNQYEYIIDLANISNDPASELDKRITLKNNYQDKVKFLNKLNHETKFIYISSCAVYGNYGKKIATIKSTTYPLSTYSKCCLLFENFIKKQKKNNYVIIRLGTLYGPSERMRYDIAINVILRNIIFKNQVNINGGEQYRLFCYINVAIKTINKILLNFHKYKHKTYNIGNKNIKINSLVNYLKKINIIKNNTKIFKNKTKDNRSYKVKFSNLTLSNNKNYFRNSILDTFRFIKKDKKPFDKKKVTLNVYKKILRNNKKIFLN